MTRKRARRLSRRNASGSPEGSGRRSSLLHSGPAALLCIYVATAPWLYIAALLDAQSAPKQALLVVVAASLLPLIVWRTIPRIANPVTCAGLAAIVFGLLVSYAFAEDHRLSLLGWYGHRFGLLSMLALVVLFVATASGTTPAQRMKIQAAGLAGVGLTAAVVALQYSRAADVFVEMMVGGLPNGGVGNSNDLAAFALLAVAFIPALPKTRRSPLLLTLYVAVLTALVIHSASRAGAALLVLTIALVASLVAIRRVPRTRGVEIGLAGGLLVGVAFSTATGATGILLGRATAKGVNLEGTGPVSELAVSGSIRLDAWRAATSAVREQPLGFGPQGLPLVVGRYRPRDSAELEDRASMQLASAHNVVLDYALGGGLLAAVGLVVVAGSVTVPVLFRARTAAEGDLFLVAGVAGYASMAMLNPESLGASGVAWVMMGCLSRGRAGPEHSVPLRLASRSLVIAPVGAAVLAILLLAAEVRAEAAASQYAQQQYRDSARSWADAARLMPIERRYRSGELLARTGVAVQTGSTADVQAAQRTARDLDTAFVPTAAELLLDARLSYILDPSDPEVDRLLARASETQPRSAYWEALIEDVKR